MVDLAVAQALSGFSRPIVVKSFRGDLIHNFLLYLHLVLAIKGVHIRLSVNVCQSLYALETEATTMPEKLRCRDVRCHVKIIIHFPIVIVLIDQHPWNGVMSHGAQGMQGRPTHALNS